MARLTTATIRLALADSRLRPRLIACMCDMETDATGEIESGLMSMFEEGEKVDVPKYLRDHGNPEAAKKWEEEHEKHQDLLKKHTAALEKKAGYTHYWRFQPRSAGVPDRLNMNRAFYNWLYKTRKELEAKLKAAENTLALAKKGQAIPWAGRSDASPDSHMFGDRMEFGRYWRNYEYEALGELADALASEGNARMAAAAEKLPDTVVKAQAAIKKAADTYVKHALAYKGKPETQWRAAVNWATRAIKLCTLLIKFADNVGKLTRDMEASDYGFTDAEWQQVAAAARKIIANAARAKPGTGTAGDYHDQDIIDAGGIVITGPNGSGKPVIDKDHIALNGDGSKDLDYETFWLSKHPESADRLFAFCKTARMPYDAVVVSILAAAQKIAPQALNISSDGGSSAIKKVLGYAQGPGRTAAHTLPLDELVQMEAETLGMPNWRAAKPTPAAKAAAQKWVKAVSKALGVWTQKFPPEYGFTVGDLMSDRGGKAPYNVYMTLANRSGVSIADGRWKLYYPKDITKLERFLDSALLRDFKALKNAIIDSADATGA